MLDAFTISITVALEYGVPLKHMARSFSYSRFEPSGYTNNPAIQVATSITDYIFRYLALRFLSESDLEELGVHAPTKELVSAETHAARSDGTVGVQVVQIRETSKATETVTTEVKRVVYADTVCRSCGGMLIQTGTCKTCIQCGTSNGGCQ